MNIHSEEEKLRYARKTVEKIRSDVHTFEARLKELGMEREKQSRIAATMSDLTQAFAQRGVQTFVLQNAVMSLESTAQAYLTELSDGAQRLEMILASGEGITRKAFVRGKGGMYLERPLASLSGGQMRRCSLALSLGFAELIARHGNFRSSLCILDEPLTHLDRSGREDVGRVLRSMLRRTSERKSNGSLGLSFSTMILILQDLAAEELEEAFDCIDEVVKKDGISTVIVDESAA
jgi:DNA repair exonuclease SbcCD ATPase subunit